MRVDSKSQNQALVNKNRSCIEIDIYQQPCLKAQEFNENRGCKSKTAILISKSHVNKHINKLFNSR